MPNSTGICDVFKRGILTANVNLNTATIKAALYLDTGSISNTTTTYTGSNEVSGAGYNAGGVTTTAGTVGLTGNIAYWQPGAAIAFGTVTLSSTFNTVLLYYTSSTVANAIAAFNFGATTVNNGTFTVNLPDNNASNALIRLA